MGQIRPRLRPAGHLPNGQGVRETGDPPVAETGGNALSDAPVAEPIDIGADLVAHHLCALLRHGGCDIGEDRVKGDAVPPCTFCLVQAAVGLDEHLRGAGAVIRERSPADADGQMARDPRNGLDAAANALCDLGGAAGGRAPQQDAELLAANATDQIVVAYRIRIASAIRTSASSPAR